MVACMDEFSVSLVGQVLIWTPFFGDTFVLSFDVFLSSSSSSLFCHGTFAREEFIRAHVSES
jgi:hypothetical protein